MDFFMAARFFALLIVTFYVYWKTLDIKGVSKLKITAAILFSFIMCIPLSYMPPLYEFLFTGSVLVFVSLTGRVRMPLMISSVIISIGISLGIDSLVWLVIYIFVTSANIIYAVRTGTWTKDIFLSEIADGKLPYVMAIIALILFLILVNFLFKTKRLKKGFLFWQNKEAVRIGVIFSSIIAINKSIVDTVHLFVIAICVFGLYFWWRDHTTALYHQRIKGRDIERYVVEIEENTRQLKELSEANDLLAKTVHRDNKLIPAMYNAVNSFYAIPTPT